MRKRISIFLRLMLTGVLCLSALGPFVAYADEVGEPENTEPPIQFNGAAGEYEADGLVVVLDDPIVDTGGMGLLTADAGIDEAMEQLDNLGATDIEEIAERTEFSGTVLKVEVPEDVDIEQAAADLTEQPGIEYAQPNFIYRLFETALDEPPAVDVDQDDLQQNDETPSTEFDEASPLPGENASVQNDGMEESSEEPEQSAMEEDAEPEATLEEQDDEDGKGLFASAASEPLAGYQYYLAGWGVKSGSTTIYGANILNAWDLIKTERRVTVAVLDTGVQVGHEDLAGNIDTARMWDAFSNTAKGTITSSSVPTGDNTGHGTHVAGIIAAVANNSKGIAGTSYNAKVLPIKVFNNSTSSASATCSTSTLVSAYQYLLGMVRSGELTDLHVINMSLGGYGGPSTSDVALQTQIRTARNNYDIVTVCAGGNGDSSTNTAYTTYSYPSDFDECVSVTALDSDGLNASWSDYNIYKDISAPGVSIYSTFNSSTSISSYKFMSGTSMATPVVAGSFALLWALRPTLDVDEAVDAVYATAVKVNTTKYDRTKPDANGIVSGSHGALDAAAAVQYVKTNYATGGGKVGLGNCTVGNIADQVYRGTALTPAVSVKNGTTTLVQGTDYTLDYPIGTDRTNAGDVTVLIKGIGGYTGAITKKFKIKPATLTVTTSSQTKVYNGSALTAAGTLTGLVNGETATLKTTGTITNVGSVKNTYTIAWGTAKAKNYVIQETLGTLTVQKASLTVTVTGNSSTKGFTGSLQAVDGFTQDNAAKATVTLKTGKKAHAEGTNPGTYAMGLKAADFNVVSQNYAVTLKVNDGSLTVVKANNLAASAKSISKTYDGKAAKLSVVATIGGNAVSGATITYYNEKTKAYDLGTAPSFTDCTGGAQVVKFMAVHPNSSNVVYGQATITIAQATLKISTSSATKVYDGKALKANGSMSGLVNGETAAFTVTGSQTATGSSKNTYEIRWNGTANSDNYSISQSLGTLKVVAGKTWVRLAGDIGNSYGNDRYGTMRAVVSKGFSSSRVVFLACGSNFPDALGAAGIAGIAEAPIILTESSVLGKNARAEIVRLKASTVYLLGSNASISSAVEKAVKAIPGVQNVSRISGPDRFATNLATYQAGKTLGTWGKTAIVTAGDNGMYADALSISAYAWAEKAPIFLVSPNAGKLSGDMLKALTTGGFTRIMILGGKNAVSTGVESQIKSACKAEVWRIAGNNRYETSASVALWSIKNSANLNADGIAIASGANFPDALAGGPTCGKMGSVLLLVEDSTAGRKGVSEVLRGNSSTIFTGYTFGGTASISDSLMAYAASLIR